MRACTKATINRELAIIKRAFSLAMEDGTLVFRPMIALLNEKGSEGKGFFSRSQFNSILKHLDVDLRPLCRFAYVTGWCIASEAFPLQWEQISFEDATVTLDPGTSKNDEVRILSLHHRTQGHPRGPEQNNGH